MEEEEKVEEEEERERVRSEKGGVEGVWAVSYTHLTLPTKRIV